MGAGRGGVSTRLDRPASLAISIKLAPCEQLSVSACVKLGVWPLDHVPVTSRRTAEGPGSSSPGLWEPEAASVIPACGSCSPPLRLVNSSPPLRLVNSSPPLRFTAASVGQTWFRSSVGLLRGPSHKVFCSAAGACCTAIRCARKIPLCLYPEWLCLGTTTERAESDASEDTSPLGTRPLPVPL